MVITSSKKMKCILNVIPVILFYSLSGVNRNRRGKGGGDEENKEVGVEANVVMRGGRRYRDE